MIKFLRKITSSISFFVFHFSTTKKKLLGSLDIIILFIPEFQNTSANILLLGSDKCGETINKKKNITVNRKKKSKPV